MGIAGAHASVWQSRGKGNFFLEEIKNGVDCEGLFWSKKKTIQKGTAKIRNLTHTNMIIRWINYHANQT